MSWTEFPTFTAGEALGRKRRVKIKSGSTSTPLQVVYADEAEIHIGITGNYDVASGDPVAITPINVTGTQECVALEALAANATLYGGDNGTIQDTSSGTAIGYALEAATASGDIIQFMSYAVQSTTAGTVSISDSGTFTGQATVEAALQEIYQDLKSAQALIPLPLNGWRITTNGDVGNIAANGGVFGSDTVPILEAITATSNACQQLNWASGEVVEISTQAIIPPDIDVTKDIIFHCRIASEGTTDAVGFTVNWWLNEGDTKVADTTATNQTTTYAEKTATLGNADVVAGSQTISISLVPAAHTTDAMYASSFWLEYTRTIRTS